MKSTNKHWLLGCVNCGFLRANLQPTIDISMISHPINEQQRAIALGKLRINNFERILDYLEKFIIPKNKRLLDVGCAHGWFLELAAQRGFTVFGLEPDRDMVTLAKSKSDCIWHGFFPEHIPPGKRFDVIIFNDVFEHIPDVKAAMNACYSLLEPNGILIINLPCSQGFFYKLATFLDKMGISKPLERLWQKEFPSPHLSYFAPHQLRQLAQKYHFKEIHCSSLPSLEIQGLWERLLYDQTSSKFLSAIIWLVLVIFIPFLSFFPSDIKLQIFQLNSVNH
ncbi:MAG: class I SAM-dependent methyltransferase [Crocosphaera sp.]